MNYTLSQIEVVEREAKDDYVDEYGSSSYSPEVQKLCADWRELQASLVEMTAELLESAKLVTKWTRENNRLHAQNKRLTSELEQAVLASWRSADHD